MINDIVSIEYLLKSNPDTHEHTVEITTYYANGQRTKRVVPAIYEWMQEKPPYITEREAIGKSSAYQQSSTNGLFWDYILTPIHYVRYGNLQTGNELDIYELTSIRCMFEAGYWGSVHAGVKIRNAASLQSKQGSLIGKYIMNGKVWVVTATLDYDSVTLIDVMPNDAYLDQLGTAE